MSHFVVVVVGPDHEAQLAPYHEFECTGLDDQYVQDIDITTESLAEWKEHGQPGEPFATWLLDWSGTSIVPFGEDPDLAGPHKYGYALTDERGEITKVVDRTNPNHKWDWYQVGGRWRGYFPLRDDFFATGTLGQASWCSAPAEQGTADIVRVGDVDWQRARAEAWEKAVERWGFWEQCFIKHGRPQPWDEVLKKHGGDIAATRSAYWAQPAMTAWREGPFEGVFSNPPEEYGYDENAYVDQCVNSALIPYAIVKDGKWYQKGDMGWFGISSNEKDPAEWAREAAKLFDSLTPGTLLTAVDCHT